MFATNVYCLLPLSLVKCLIYLYFNHIFIVGNCNFPIFALANLTADYRAANLGLSLDNISLNTKY